MTTPMIIGITGKARSGKDTLARVLRDHQGFDAIMWFAEPLKRAAAILFDIPFAEVMSDEFKDAVIPGWNLTGRDILQRLGTEAMRHNFGEDFWIRRWAIEYDRRQPQRCVVADVRFENEADHLRSLGGQIIHLSRPGAGLKAGEGAHESESGITFRDGDVAIRNDGTISDLARQVSYLFEGATA